MHGARNLTAEKTQVGVMQVAKLSDFEENERLYTVRNREGGYFVGFGRGTNGQLVETRSEVAIVLEEELRVLVGDEDHDWRAHHRDPRLNGTTFVIRDLQGRVFDPVADVFVRVPEIQADFLFTNDALETLYATHDVLRRRLDKGTANAGLFSTLVGEVTLWDESGEPAKNINEASKADTTLAVSYADSEVPDEVVTKIVDVPVGELSTVMKEWSRTFPEYTARIRQAEPCHAPAPSL